LHSLFRDLVAAAVVAIANKAVVVVSMDLAEDVVIADDRDLLKAVRSGTPLPP
jgi:hypothetical protein